MADREQVVQILKKNLKKVLSDWDDDRFSLSQTFQELGADSLDSFNIIFSMIKELKLKIKGDEIPPTQNVGEIVDFMVSAQSNPNPLDKTKI